MWRKGIRRIRLKGWLVGTSRKIRRKWSRKVRWRVGVAGGVVEQEEKLETTKITYLLLR